MPTLGDWRLVRLTDANVKPKNNHVYLTSCLDFFPDDAIGGADTLVAGRPLNIKFCPGSFVQTDIAGDKKILRARSEVGEFFRLARASGGEKIRITYVGDRSYVFEMEQSSS